MEESEKRRERLRAMRAEAAQADSFSNFATPAMPSSYLSNPLIENPALEEPRSAPRFDFYTDPMSAFSENKTRNGPSDRMNSGPFAPPVNSTSPVLRFPPPPPGTRNVEASPQVRPFQGNYSPDQRMYQRHGFGHNPIPQRSPVGMSRPFNMHQGNTDPSIAPGVAASYNYDYQSPGPREGRFPTPGFGPSGSPYNASQGGGQWVNNSPRPGSGYRGSASPSWGRGGGRWHGSGPSPSSGRRGGRGGPGSGGRSFMADRPSGPERFYNDSMIEDPWKFLEPVIWREVEVPLSGPDSSKPWTPRSPGAKKAKVLDDSNKSGSQPSLAEYLAASFNEAVGDAPST